MCEKFAKKVCWPRLTPDLAEVDYRRDEAKALKSAEEWKENFQMREFLKYNNYKALKEQAEWGIRFGEEKHSGISDFWHKVMKEADKCIRAKGEENVSMSPNYSAFLLDLFLESTLKILER